jgi:hypothetical protein
LVEWGAEAWEYPFQTPFGGDLISKYHCTTKYFQVQAVSEDFAKRRLTLYPRPDKTIGNAGAVGGYKSQQNFARILPCCFLEGYSC